MILFVPLTKLMRILSENLLFSKDFISINKTNISCIIKDIPQESFMYQFLLNSYIFFETSLSKAVVVL